MTRLTVYLVWIGGMDRIRCIFQWIHTAANWFIDMRIDDQANWPNFLNSIWLLDSLDWIYLNMWINLSFLSIFSISLVIAPNSETLKQKSGKYLRF